MDTSPTLSSGVRKQPRRCGYSRQNKQSRIELEYIGERADDTDGYRHRALKHKRGRYLVTDGTGFCLEVLPSRKFSGRFAIVSKAGQRRCCSSVAPNLSLEAARCKVTSSRRSGRASFPGSPDAYREAYLCSPCRGRCHENLEESYRGRRRSMRVACSTPLSSTWPSRITNDPSLTSSCCPGFPCFVQWVELS